MSPPWSRRHDVIVLSHDGIGLCLGGSGRLRQLAEASAQPLTELEQQAPALGLRRVRILLSNQLLRYTVLPWQVGVYSEADWQALAAHQFRQQYGTAAEGWDLRVSLQGYAQPAVACALDAGLIAQLTAIARSAGWTLLSIEPALMAVFNRHRARLAQADQWLLIVEPQRLVLAQLGAGTWQHFYVDSPLAGEEATSAQRLISQALHLQGATAPKAIACFGPSAMLPTQLAEGLPLLRLPSHITDGQRDDSHLHLLAGVA